MNKVVSRTFPLFTGLLAGLGLSLSACNFREDKVNIDQTPVVITEADLHYAVVNERVIAPYCLGCHSAAGGNLGSVNLETYAALSSEIASVKSEAIEARSMPPSNATSLPANGYNLLKAWIDAGAPE